MERANHLSLQDLLIDSYLFQKGIKNTYNK